MSSNKTKQHSNIKKWPRNEICYCSNVHAGQDFEHLLAQIETHFVPIKNARKLKSMSLGLWFNEDVINTLLNDNHKAQQFADSLYQNQLKIITLNAFPQLKFHGQSIKTNVYLPDWSQHQRFQYTQKLITFIQAHPSIFHKKISISTLPLAYKKNWSAKQHLIAIKHLHEIADNLSTLKQSSDIDIRICLEMEPDCVLESSTQMINFFKTARKNCHPFLMKIGPIAVHYFPKMNVF